MNFGFNAITPGKKSEYDRMRDRLRRIRKAKGYILFFLTMHFL